MPDIHMARHHLPVDKIVHPGLLLERGFSVWKEAGDKRGESIAKLIVKASAIKSPDIYQHAYKRWYRQCLTREHGEVWFGKLDNSRLFIGSGEPGSIEASITLHHSYGVPFIPGSSIKGVVCAFAKRQGIEKGVRDFMFGIEPSLENESGDSGYLVFHDAWWVPGSAPTPLAPEIVTVHHAEYYKGEGGSATDFDSPNPNSQVAARGAFLFSIEGSGSLVAWGVELLKEALRDEGIGAKSAAGYGYFSEDKIETRAYATELANIKEEKKQRLHREMEEQEAEEEICSNNLTGIAEEICRAGTHERWKENAGAFLDAASMWISKLEAEDDPIAREKGAQYLADILDRGKNSGIMSDPEKMVGKRKDRPAYKPRPKELAIRLRKILSE